LVAATRLTPSQVVSPTPTTYSELAAGSNHNCAITAGGGVHCWGSNGSGQLGINNVITSQFAAVAVSGISSGTTSITAGDAHSCAVVSGGARCWGSNARGQIGDGVNTVTPRFAPSAVTTLSSDVLAVAAGGNHSCALLTNGSVKCWGSNDFGQLGDGTTSQRTTPTAVSMPSDSGAVVAITAGKNHTCALTDKAAIYCWGANASGQLGSGDSVNRLLPTPLRLGNEITFNAPARAPQTQPTTLSATTALGGSVSFDTWTPSACSVSGTTVTGIALGWCGIRAFQPGEANLRANARQEFRLVRVTPPVFPVNATVAPTGAGTITCTPNPVETGTTAQCVVIPSIGRRTQSISGCGGTATAPGNNSMTTGLVTAACAVSATIGPFCNLDFTGDGQVDLLDAMVFSRYSLGFRSTALVVGVPTFPSGINPADFATTVVARILATGSPTMDLDGDGQQRALTDALLFHRLIAGIPAAGFMQGVSTAGARNTKALIASHVNAICGTSY
jgi:hypothetical protein